MLRILLGIISGGESGPAHEAVAVEPLLRVVGLRHTHVCVLQVLFRQGRNPAENGGIFRVFRLEMIRQGRIRVRAHHHIRPILVGAPHPPHPSWSGSAPALPCGGCTICGPPPLRDADRVLIQANHRDRRPPDVVLGEKVNDAHFRILAQVSLFSSSLKISARTPLSITFCWVQATRSAVAALCPHNATCSC